METRASVRSCIYSRIDYPRGEATLCKAYFPEPWLTCSPPPLPRQAAQRQGRPLQPDRVRFLSQGFFSLCALGPLFLPDFNVLISRTDSLKGPLLGFLRGFIEINQITCLARCLVHGERSINFSQYINKLVILSMPQFPCR